MTGWRSSPTLIVGVLGFLLVAIALLPMRFAFDVFGLDRAGVTASAVRGSIWNGRIERLHVGRVDLGTMDAALSPIPLVLGRARLELSRHNGAPDDLMGAIIVTRHGMGIDDATGSVPMARVLAPLPIEAVDLDHVSLAFVDGACARASGIVRARVAPIGQALTGAVRCDGGRLLLLFGDVAAPARVELRVAGDGSYTGAMVAGGEIGSVLSTLGLASASKGPRLEVSGQLR